MIRIRAFRALPIAAVLTLAAPASLAAPAGAQEVVAAPNPDADRLAAQIRVLAAEPRNLEALLAAGELSARLGDTPAAFAFFARAEGIAPGNPRIFAGRGATLVRLERPGEALRLFQRAEEAGMDPASFAADRGLAYDLVGRPDLAQPEYARAAERGFSDDETVRRHALSLGISGKVAQGLTLLDPLLRRSDRAAWRSRAFLLAMAGDVEGAQRIAASMMPNNMGEALTPFFRRLPALSPADRAFAVHFGQIMATRTRLADAQLIPPLPRPVPDRPLQAALARPALAAPDQPQFRPRGSRRDRERKALVVPQPRVAAADPNALPPEPGPPPTAPVVQPLPAERAPSPFGPAATPAPAPVQLAGRSVTTVARAPGDSAAAAASAPAPARDAGLDEIMRGIAVVAAPEEEPAAPAVVAAAVPSTSPDRVAEAAPKREPAKPEAAKKPAAAAKAKPKPDPAKLEPRRHWVQLGIGADVKALPTTWRKLAKDAPVALKGKAAWMTPLRATNRLLTGPFKTDDEAQAFVNALKKEGVSAYTFTSDPGQKVTRVAVK